MSSKETELQCHYRVTTKISELIQESKTNECLRFIDNELSINKYTFLFAEKALILRQLGKSGDALNVIEDGLNEDITDYKLHKIKANILAYDFWNAQNVEEYLRKAQSTIRLAKKYFDEKHKDFKENIADIFNVGNQVVDYITDLMEIKNLEININQLISFVQTYTEIYHTRSIVQQTEQRIFADRIRTIEILGLFVGIFAFIIISVQISVNFEMLEAISIIIVVGLTLLIFLFTLHLVLFPQERKWLYIVLIIFLLFITIFVIPLLPELIKGIKYILKL